MDFTLRCNSLKCRTQLNDRAVVTTCSHVFCIQCSDNLGLSNPGGKERLCPACGTYLSNNDDAVVTHLSPTEDYKTSVLSGLSPSIIMECAGRALTFYSYQATQEIFYQEYLAKGLTEKYGNLSSHLDQIIHDANAEITNLRNKISNSDQAQEDLRKRLMTLQMDYDDKCKAHRKVQVEYDKLKKGVLQSDFKVAAADVIEQSLHAATESRYNTERGSLPGPRQPFLRQDALHERQGSGHSGGDGGRGRGDRRTFASTHDQLFSSQGSPSPHRTRLPVPTPHANRASSLQSGHHHQQPFSRQILSNLNPSTTSNLANGTNVAKTGPRVGKYPGMQQY